MTKHVNPAAVKTVNLQPGHGRAGRHPTREFLDSLSGHKDPGKFGRMFPRLEPLRAKDEALAALAEAMLDANAFSPEGNNPHVPAGFTYLGQFVDHDITLDLTSLSEKEKDPLAIENFRTPSLDLDCLYGLGPDGSPHLYARNPQNGNKHGPKFLLGRNITVDFGGVTGDFRNDLPRSPEGFAATTATTRTSSSPRPTWRCSSSTTRWSTSCPAAPTRRRTCSRRPAGSSPGITSG